LQLKIAIVPIELDLFQQDTNLYDRLAH